ncbi:hypothetical protein L3X38_023888 [Prunus dulcis]|uniref:Uncharacterized protein n=1 Tax=Prunus dulcis TaxID=3755 RepID=A0AAD4Z5W5_PRUDU|nr:hypothetical protein L3X38_023888 [Prunus dulcis]
MSPQVRLDPVLFVVHRNSAQYGAGSERIAVQISPRRTQPIVVCGPLNSKRNDNYDRRLVEKILFKIFFLCLFFRYSVC